MSDCVHNEGKDVIPTCFECLPPPQLDEDSEDPTCHCGIELSKHNGYERHEFVDIREHRFAREHLSLLNVRPGPDDYSRAHYLVTKESIDFIKPEHLLKEVMATVAAKERQACIDVLYRVGVGGASADPIIVRAIEEIRRRSGS